MNLCIYFNCYSRASNSTIQHKVISKHFHEILVYLFYSSNTYNKK